MKNKTTNQTIKQTLFNIKGLFKPKPLIDLGVIYKLKSRGLNPYFNFYFPLEIEVIDLLIFKQNIYKP